MATIALVEGNTTPDLSVLLTHRTGPQDLTGATVVARLTNQNTAEAIALACSIVAPSTDGRILVIAPNTGWVVGDWTIEYDVTYANAELQTFPNKAEDIDLILVRPVSEVVV